MSVHACKLEDSARSSEVVFFKRIVGQCSLEEKKALAIPAENLFHALQSGKSIEVDGVVIVGDLMLDQLPIQPIYSKYIPSAPVRKDIEQRGIQEGRIIRGSLSIRDSLFQGVLATNLKQGVLLIHGDVNITGTTFERSIDFSKTIFLAPVDFSRTAIQHEGFFIGARFNKPSTFEKTVFGTHSRFHKAWFGSTTTFSQAEFRGLAEFLEVVFEEDAIFSKSSFMAGTGFSGARFKGNLDLSEAVFAREVFFRFTTFENDVSFRQTTFRKVVDFTNAKFQATHDFSRAVFEVEPTFFGTKLESSPPQLSFLHDRKFQIGLFILLLTLTVFIIYSLWKRSAMKA